MRSDLVVLPEPNIDSDLGLPCGVEPFSVEEFFSQGAVKALVIPIFPRQERYQQLVEILEMFNTLLVIHHYIQHNHILKVTHLVRSR